MSRKMCESLQRDVQDMITRFPSFRISVGVGLQFNDTKTQNMGNKYENFTYMLLFQL